MEAGTWRRRTYSAQAVRAFGGLTSSQPSGLTESSSLSLSTTVVVSASMMAGPASLAPGLRSSSVEVDLAPAAEEERAPAQLIALAQVEGRNGLPICFVFSSVVHSMRDGTSKK